MVLVQKWQFFHVFFKCNIDQENVFPEILERKVPFYSINTEVQKVEIFPKGLNHGFGQKMTIFPFFF